MSRVIGRFYVRELVKRAGDTATVHLQATTSKENASWSQYTPNGQIEMDLTRKASGAREAFEAHIGDECLVTFDFDVAPGEAPEYRMATEGGDPDTFGYVDET